MPHLSVQQKRTRDLLDNLGDGVLDACDVGAHGAGNVDHEGQIRRLDAGKRKFGTLQHPTLGKAKDRDWRK